MSGIAEQESWRAEYAHACTQAVVFDLSSRGRITLTGKDAVVFLHNLVSNDIKNLAHDHGCETFLTTHKARTISHGFVTRSRQGERDWLLLDVASGTGNPVFTHLDRHLISEEVELADLSDQSCQLHLCGPGAAAVLSRCAGRPVPELANLQTVWDSGRLPTTSIRRHDWLGLPGWDLFLASHRLEEVRDQLLAAGAVLGSPATWNVLRIEAGWPEWGRELDENRFVVETGRIAQAISYTKGCYLGQEPIVMARDRGHVNRTLLGLKLADTASADPAGCVGTKVLCQDQEIGQVTSAACSPRLACTIALAYVRRGHWTTGLAVEVETPAGRTAAEVAALPFIKTLAG